MDNKKKYFVIGFNKTATMSLAKIMKRNGISTQHAKGHSWNLSKHQAFLDNHDDIMSYEEYYEKYPDSLFILSTRNLEQWLVSRFKHGMSRGGESWILPMRVKCEAWIKTREIHYMKVINFFKSEPSRLIILNIDDPGWIKFICRKLGFKDDRKTRMHVRPNESVDEIYMKRITDTVRTTMDEMGITMEQRETKFLLKNDEAIRKLVSLYKNNL